MTAKNWLSKVPMIGERSHREIAEYAAEVGERVSFDEPSELYDDPTTSAIQWLGHAAVRPWLATGHVFGFVEPRARSGLIDIIHAGDVEPDRSLSGGRVRITLDALHAASYPGRGPYTVLVHIVAESGNDHLSAKPEFSRKFSVRKGDNVAVIGLPILANLPVGPEGIVMTCAVINVTSQGDEQLLSLLDSDVFKAGLDLSLVAGPALAFVTKFAAGITESVLRKRRNAVIQRFDLGLDLAAMAARLKLREGSYIVVQLPTEARKGWSWRSWQFDPATSRIVARENRLATPELNYIAFSVSRCGV